MKLILSLVGLRVVYVCSWGRYRHRYGAIDANMQRPIHEGMSVAPPWARMTIEQENPNG